MSVGGGALVGASSVTDMAGDGVSAGGWTAIVGVGSASVTVATIGSASAVGSAMLPGVETVGRVDESRNTPMPTRAMANSAAAPSAAARMITTLTGLREREAGATLGRFPAVVTFDGYCVTVLPGAGVARGRVA